MTGINPLSFLVFGAGCFTSPRGTVSNRFEHVALGSDSILRMSSESRRCFSVALDRRKRVAAQNNLEPKECKVIVKEVYGYRKTK